MARMAGQLTAAGWNEGGWGVDVGRRLALSLGVLAMGAWLLWVVGGVGVERRVTAGPVAQDHTTALRRAIGGVLVATAVVEGVREGEGQAGKAEAALEDAWLTLAVVYDRVEAQLAVAAGGRAPLMGAQPPAPGRSAGPLGAAGAERGRALVRSALPYVRGAIVGRDRHVLERANALLEMARS